MSQLNFQREFGGFYLFFGIFEPCHHLQSPQLQLWLSSTNSAFFIAVRVVMRGQPLYHFYRRCLCILCIANKWHCAKSPVVAAHFFCLQNLYYPSCSHFVCAFIPSSLIQVVFIIFGIFLEIPNHELFLCCPSYQKSNIFTQLCKKSKTHIVFLKKCVIIDLFLKFFKSRSEQ